MPQNIRTYALTRITALLLIIIVVAIHGAGPGHCRYGISNTTSRNTTQWPFANAEDYFGCFDLPIANWGKEINALRGHLDIEGTTWAQLVQDDLPQTA